MEYYDELLEAEIKRAKEIDDEGLSEYIITVCEVCELRDSWGNGCPCFDVISNAVIENKRDISRELEQSEAGIRICKALREINR